MIIHKRVFQEVGFFNERTFLYFEELDFFTRARAKGYTQGYIPGPVVHHQGGGSSEGEKMSSVRTYHETISMLDHYKRHFPVLLPVLFLIRTPIKIISLLISGRAKLVTSVLSGCWDSLLRKNKHLKLAKDLSEVYFKRVQ